MTKTPPHSRAEQAALYARRYRITLANAAAAFDVHEASVSEAWSRLFGTHAALGKRDVAWPEDEVTL